MSFKIGTKVVVLYSVTSEKFWHGRVGTVLNNEHTGVILDMGEGVEIRQYHSDVAEVQECVCTGRLVTE
jgi:hypothetical protein